MEEVPAILPNEATPAIPAVPEAYLNQVIDPGDYPGGVSFSWDIDRRKGTGGLSIGWVQPDVDGATDRGENIEIKIGSSKDFGSLKIKVDDGTEDDDLEDDQTRITFERGTPGGEVRIVRHTNIGQRERLICRYTGPDIVILLDRSP